MDDLGAARFANWEHHDCVKLKPARERETVNGGLTVVVNGWSAISPFSATTKRDGGKLADGGLIAGGKSGSGWKSSCKRDGRQMRGGEGYEYIAARLKKWGWRRGIRDKSLIN